jgi:hypothetical protein
MEAMFFKNLNKVDTGCQMTRVHSGPEKWQ